MADPQIEILRREYLRTKVEYLGLVARGRAGRKAFETSSRNPGRLALCDDGFRRRETLRLRLKRLSRRLNERIALDLTPPPIDFDPVADRLDELADLSALALGYWIGAPCPDS